MDSVPAEFKHAVPTHHHEVEAYIQKLLDMDFHVTDDITQSNEFLSPVLEYVQLTNPCEPSQGESARNIIVEFNSEHDIPAKRGELTPHPRIPEKYALMLLNLRIFNIHEAFDVIPELSKIFPHQHHAVFSEFLDNLSNHAKNNYAQK